MTENNERRFLHYVGSVCVCMCMFFPRCHALSASVFLFGFFFTHIHPVIVFIIRILLSGEKIESIYHHVRRQSINKHDDYTTTTGVKRHGNACLSGPFVLILDLTPR